MSPRHWFGLIVRVLGLLAVVASPFYVLAAIMQSAQAVQMPEASPAGWLIYGVAIAGAGLYMLRGAPHLVRFAYPENKGLQHPRKTGPAAAPNGGPAKAADSSGTLGGPPSVS